MSDYVQCQDLYAVLRGKNSIDLYPVLVLYWSFKLLKQIR